MGDSDDEGSEQADEERKMPKKVKPSFTVYYLPELIDEHVEPNSRRKIPEENKVKNLLINDESDEDSDGDNLLIEDENISGLVVGSFKPGCDSKNARNNFAQK